MTVRQFDATERRARLVTRHGLDPSTRADDPVGAARYVVALHATDPLTVFLSVRARTNGVGPEDIEHAVVEDRSLVRWMGWRRTLWAAPRELIPVIHASATRAVAARERRSLTAVVASSGITDPERWLDDVEHAVVEALAAREEATTSELIEAVPAMAAPMRTAVGTRWERTHRAGALVLPLLAMQGRLVRGRPRGTWVSSQFHWATTESWLGGPVDDQDPAAARAEVVRLWLRTFGPGTEADLRWWTGWPARDIRAVLAAVPHAQVDLDGAVGYVLDDDLEPTPVPEPEAALLPTLDPTTMGWRDRDWYFGQPDGLVDSVGNVGPTVWWAGRVVGGWAQRPDGVVVTGLKEDVGADARRAIAEEADRVRDWLGSVRLAPRVLPPYQRTLVD
ncbi:winged helix DNA-binding domain-containing protein [Georgenia yuyongxinii]|uniref:Winged helix DNA-binding domain-containing protein n=1 Tax=Georgenia yuyongxinii TaxID=2589797 RepID=A0A5B8BZZ8_9MICO|nr:winged helix DNA-binding domain-containing protein [Georgenia yuyongxinii]QDC23397.1 winged helix DNA-binding domain-containing protein [Georgenia yuyongxinii]